MLFAVFDNETTGLPFHRKSPLESQPRIIEFAGIITDGKEILHELEFICNPGIAIEAIITQITGLKNEDLQDKPRFMENIGDLDTFFGKADCAIAHNASFDRSMLAYDLQRVGGTLDTISFPPMVICTVEQTFHQYGKMMKLIDLYEEHCGKYVQDHRAMSDVKLLHELCQKIGVYEAFTEN
jgi:DNA polymerase III epsilon subunit-like protein